jgi:hypothetical protein
MHHALSRISGCLIGSCIAFALAALATLCCTDDLGAFIAYLIGSVLMGTCGVWIEGLIAPTIPDDPIARLGRRSPRGTSYVPPRAWRERRLRPRKP